MVPSSVLRVGTSMKLQVRALTTRFPPRDDARDDPPVRATRWYPRSAGDLAGS